MRTIPFRGNVSQGFRPTGPAFLGGSYFKYEFELAKNKISICVIDIVVKIVIVTAKLCSTVVFFEEEKKI
jgi:hypothetical protein